MKLFAVASVLAATVAPVLGQLVGIAAPANGTVLSAKEHFVSRIRLPSTTVPAAPCQQVGIALSIANCDQGCPDPKEMLGSVLYAGPFNPTAHGDVSYQEFEVQVPQYMPPGEAMFFLTHLCLLGGGPLPVLEFLNTTVTIRAQS